MVVSTNLLSVQLPESLNPLGPVNFSKPLHYKICHEPNVAELYVKTTQTITFEVIREPNSDFAAYLNSYSETVIKNATLNGELIAFEPATDASGKDYAGSVLKYTIPASQAQNLSKIGSKYTVDIESHSKICDDLEGIYLSKFKSKDSTEHSLLTTQYESHFARKSFLCIDEPAAKAKFDVSFIVDANKEVIFNTPIKEQKKIEGTDKVLHTFETTPTLSTYLIGFAIGNFVRKSEIVKNTDGSDIYVEVVAPVGTRDNLMLPLCFSVEHMKTLMKYFGKFPISKVSHLAVPDFRSGAMENNGIITYRDSFLLIDDETPLRIRIWGSFTVAHEISHHWFGNLVTMEWWNGLWLNESFANAIEYEIAQETHERLGNDKIYQPNFVFALHDKIEGMELDSKNSTHPIQSTIDSPEDIETIFDEISYQKGGTLLKMLINYLTPDVFFGGIRAYLKKYEYSNAKGEDLWKVMDETTGQDISGMMKTWITMSGFPAVSYRYNSELCKITIAQNQYMSVAEASSDKIWHIPINFEYTTESGKKNCVKFILDQKEAAIDLPKDDKIALIKLDSGSNTMTVSDPDKTLNEAAIANFLKLSDIEKFSFFANLNFLLSSIKIVDGNPMQSYANATITSMIETIKKISVSKDDFAARLGLIDLLGTLNTIFKLVNMAVTGSYEKFKRFAYSIIAEFPEPTLDLESFKEYLPYETNRRMVSLLFRLEDDKLISKCAEMYLDAEKNGAELDETIMTYVYRAHVLKNINSMPADEAKKLLVELLEKANNDIFSRTRMMKLAGICMGVKGKLNETLLDFGFSDKVRLQDARIFVYYIIDPETSYYYSQYVAKHVDKVAQFTHPRRIDVLKGFRGCSTQADIDALESLRNYKPSKITEDRIFDETKDFIIANKLTAEVFEGQVKSFEF